MELYERLYSLGEQLGREIFDDPDSFRGALDDFMDEGAASTGDINLLVDGVRLGAFRRMLSMIDSGAAPGAAVEAAGELLSRERGSADVAGSRWACAVLGYAVGKVSAMEVQRYRTTTIDSREQPSAGWISPTEPAGPSADPATPPTEAAAPPAPVTSPPVTSPPVPSPPVTSPPATTGHDAPPQPSPAGYTQPEQWPPPAAPQPYHPAPRKTPWILIFAVVAVVVLALVGGVTWLVTAGPLGQPTDDPTRAAESPDGGPAAKSVTCWDGEKVANPKQCTEPARSEAGLRWAFPSLDRDFATCRARVGGTPDTPVRSWFCPVGESSEEGRSYTYWTSASRARENYAEEYPQPATDLFLAGTRAGYRWRLSSPNSEGLFKLSLAYAPVGDQEWPFSMSVYALSPRSLDRSCAQVLMRSPKDFAQVTPGCG